MVYPPSPYVTKARVRLEAGRITSTVDLPDADIDAIINSVDRFIDDRTDKEETGWLGTEAMFPFITQISALMSGALSRMRFGDEDGKGEKQWKKAMEMLKELTGEEQSATIIWFVAQDQTFPKNPNAPWSRGRYDTTGIQEVDVDPDAIYQQD